MAPDGGYGLRDLGLCWWCRGAGVAVLLLPLVVTVFRDHDNWLFWAAWAFFAWHAVTTSLRFSKAARNRTTVAVVDTHDTSTRRRRRTPAPLPPSTAVVERR